MLSRYSFLCDRPSIFIFLALSRRFVLRLYDFAARTAVLTGLFLWSGACFFRLFRDMSLDASIVFRGMRNGDFEV